MSPNKHKAGEPLRVLYVHNSADFYGASRSLMRLLGVLDRSRFEPCVILPEDGPLKSHLEKHGVVVFIDPSLAIISRYSSRALTIGYKFPVSVARLLKFIKREKIDLVHTNIAVVFSPGFAAKLARIPHVWHVRESFHEFQRSLWKIYSRYMQTFSDKIVAVSNATAAQFPNQSKVVVIHNGFSLDEFAVDRLSVGREFRGRFGIAEKDVVIGCVGRIKWGRKGQEDLVRAAHLLKTRGHAAKYLIVGLPYTGNEAHLERLKNLASDLGLRDDVIFTGELPDPKPAYAAMDIFVLPSAQPEPFGGVVMEAMAMRLPVIATAIGGSLDQVADGVTGFLVAPADASQLATKIELLAIDPELRQKMGAAGMERIGTDFGLEKMLRKIEDVYEAVTLRER